MTINRLMLIFALVLALALPTLVLAQGGSPVTVTMKAQNNSGESGTTTLTSQDGKTRVVINLTGAPAGVAQPAHIHKGTCANLDPKPAFPLTNVMDGKSTTTVDVSLDALMKEQFAVNVHKSGAEAAVYVSCGEIPMQAAAAAAPKQLPTTGAPMIGGIAALGMALIGVGVLLRRRFS